MNLKQAGSFPQCDNRRHEVPIMIGRLAVGVLGIALGLAEEVVDECLGVDFSLDVERRRGVVEWRIALAAPDELGIEIGIALLLSDLDGFFRLTSTIGYISSQGMFLRVASR